MTYHQVTVSRTLRALLILNRRRIRRAFGGMAVPAKPIHVPPPTLFKPR